MDAGISLQENFKPIVKASKGFEYRPEWPDAKSFVAQKWGWTATQPGAWAELEFDSRSGSKFNTSSERAEVYLSHLKSYTGMGTATVECVSGCTCSSKKMVLDGTWAERSTLMQPVHFKVGRRLPAHAPLEALAAQAWCCCASSRQDMPFTLPVQCATPPIGHADSSTWSCSSAA